MHAVVRCFLSAACAVVSHRATLRHRSRTASTACSDRRVETTTPAYGEEGDGGGGGARGEETGVSWEKTPLPLAGVDPLLEYSKEMI